MAYSTGDMRDAEWNYDNEPAEDIAVTAKIREALQTAPGKYFSASILAEMVFGNPFQRKAIQDVSATMSDVEVLPADENRNYSRYRLI